MANPMRSAAGLPLNLPLSRRPKKDRAKRSHARSLPPTASFCMPVVERQANGLKVVLFAGGGGSCTGIEAGLARLGDPSPYVDAAVNHDPEAVAMHRANHPRTRHYCNNVWRVHPQQIINDFGGRPIDLLWASPDCKHFSKAKGGKPVEKHIRDLAWVVVAYARLPAHLRPNRIYLENVEEFRHWSPERQRRWPNNGKPMFDLHGKPVMEPDPSKRGETFNRWARELKRLGGRLEMREIKASVKKTPTIRKRLYIIIAFDGQDITWGPDICGTAPGLQPFRTAAECIDFSIPCPSIFITKAEAKRQKLRIIRPLATASERRIATGVGRFVLHNPDPFLIQITHQGDDRTRSIHTPAWTSTTAHRGETALIEPNIVRVAHGERDHKGKKRGRGEHSARLPLPTQQASKEFAVTAPVVVNYKGDSSGSPMTAGVPTVTANSFIKRPGGSAPLGMAAPVMIGRHSGHGNDVRAASPESPANTLTASGGPFVAAPVLAGCGGRAAQSPPRSVTEPNSTGTTKADQILAAPTLIQTGYGEREGQAPRALEIGKPLGTPVAGGVKHAVAAIHLAQNNTGMVGHSAAEPVSTIVQKGCTQSVVATHVINMKGSDRRDAAIDGPAPAQCAQGTHVGIVYAFMVQYHATGGQHAAAEQPMRTVDCEDRHGVITVEAIPEPYLTPEQRVGALRCVRFLQKYGVLPKDSRAVMVLVKGMPMVDIGMRMLKPRELFNAQGFPPTYIIDRGLFVDPVTGEQEWRTLTTTAQVRMCGNSVCPPVAEDIIFGDYPANDNWTPADLAVPA